MSKTGFAAVAFTLMVAGLGLWSKAPVHADAAVEAITLSPIALHRAADVNALPILLVEDMI
jgi:hypothetical protein